MIETKKNQVAHTNGSRFKICDFIINHNKQILHNKKKKLILCAVISYSS